MPSPLTICQILKAEPYPEYEQGLLDSYLEIVLKERAPNQQLANEMFRAFPSVVIRFGDIIFTRGYFRDQP